MRNNEESRMPTEGVGVDSGIHRIHRNYNQEYAHMEAWLDEHPDFVQDYFLRYLSLMHKSRAYTSLFIQEATFGSAAVVVGGKVELKRA